MQHFALEQALNYLIQTGAINLKPLDGKNHSIFIERLAARCQLYLH